jgi:hypothetical protein
LLISGPKEIQNLAKSISNFSEDSSGVISVSSAIVRFRDGVAIDTIYSDAFLQNWMKYDKTYFDASGCLEEKYLPLLKKRFDR